MAYQVTYTTTFTTRIYIEGDGLGAEASANIVNSSIAKIKYIINLYVGVFRSKVYKL